MVVAKRDPKVLIAQDYLAQKRVSRRPQHKFNLKLVPYEIQPFMLAPVLPGESLTNIMLQSQSWSDPLHSTMKNIGWWMNYNFFYVRHRDLPSEVRTLLAQMMLDPDTDISSIKSATTKPALYTYAGAVDWMNLCLQHIVSEYFRDEGEDWNEAVGPNGLPLAAIYGRGTADAFERLTLEDEYEDRRVDLIDAEGHLYANDLATMQGHWMAMREAGLTEMDYEDFMKTYGSSVREDEESPNLHRAEDIWSLREFTYPTNTVEPTTGVPASAVGWRISKSGGKTIFADEPGFIIGLQYARPKVYLGFQRGSAAGAMDSVRQWLPAVLHNQADLGHVYQGPETGPFPHFWNETDGNVGYWFDIRDLLAYGDQYVNYTIPSQTDGVREFPFANLPRYLDAARRYVIAGEVRAMFADAFKENGHIQVDGLCSLTIKGRQRPSQPGLTLGRS